MILRCSCQFMNSAVPGETCCCGLLVGRETPHVINKIITTMVHFSEYSGIKYSYTSTIHGHDMGNYSGPSLHLSFLFFSFMCLNVFVCVGAGCFTLCLRASPTKDRRQHGQSKDPSFKSDTAIGFPKSGAFFGSSIFGSLLSHGV